MEVTRKQSTFFEKFGGFCFIVTSVLGVSLITGEIRVKRYSALGNFSGGGNYGKF